MKLERDVAPSNQTCCRMCGKRFKKGSKRFYTTQPSGFRGGVTKRWYCAASCYFLEFLEDNSDDVGQIARALMEFPGLKKTTPKIPDHVLEAMKKWAFVQEI